MRAVRIVYEVAWGAFWAYWLIAARSSKRSLRGINWSSQVGIRAVIIAVVYVLVKFGLLRHLGRSAAVWRAAPGLLLLAAGLGFAIWARGHLGRNWGTPMSQKDSPELVTSGPYRFARHPIYSGILLAGIGTAVGLGWQWLVAVLLAGIYFGYSATVEERYMSDQFPDAYPAYKAATKILVPFVF